MREPAGQKIHKKNMIERKKCSGPKGRGPNVLRPPTLFICHTFSYVFFRHRFPHFIETPSRSIFRPMRNIKVCLFLYKLNLNQW